MNTTRTLILGFLVSFVACPVLSAQDAAQEEKGFLGILYKKAEGENGIEVIRTVQGSPAESKLLINDVILKIGDEEANDLGQVRDNLQQRKPDQDNGQGNDNGAFGSEKSVN